MSETVPLVLGMLGDFTTFVGGLILAWDVVRQPLHFEEVRRIKRTFESPELKGRRIELDDVTVKNPEEDVEYVFIRRSAKTAKVGIVVLVIGFAFLFAARLAELAKAWT